MVTQELSNIFSGLTGGVSSERNDLNLFPSKLHEDSRNIEALRDQSFRPRRGIDFIGTQTDGDYMNSVVTASSITQIAPSGFYAPFKASDGSIVERTIVFINNQFKIFSHPRLRYFDSPNQTISPTNQHVGTLQNYFTVDFHFGDNKVFFSGKYLLPGYLYLDSDNTTLNVVYLGMYFRDYSGTDSCSHVQYQGKYYQCIEAHTSAATDLTDTDEYGETVFNRYWVQLNNADIPGATATWSAGNNYVTNVQKRVDRYSALLVPNNPYRVQFWNNRLWLADEDKVYYSRIAIDVDNTNTELNGVNTYAVFMEETDPYLTGDPAPSAADGGFINVSNGTIKDLKQAADAMFFGTTTAIFEIRGDSGKFRHTDFKVEKVVNDGINGTDNMVNAEEKLVVFGTNNIYMAIESVKTYPGQITTFGKISTKQIKGYYTSIPKLNKGTGRAVYSPTKEKVYFFHNDISTQWDETRRIETGQSGYARSILIVDISNRTNDISTSTEGEVFVQGQMEIWNYANTAHSGEPYLGFAYISAPVDASVNNVVVGNDQVIAGAGNNVVVSGLSGSQQGSDEIVCIALKTSAAGTSDYHAALVVLESAQLQDWYSDVDLRTDYDAIAILGQQTLNDITLAKSVRYLVFALEKMTAGTASCLFRSAFNFAYPNDDGEATGKTAAQVEIYQDTKTVGNGGTVSFEDYRVSTYKYRVRGRGMTFQPAFQNTPGKDFRLLGWGQLLKTKRRIG